MSHVEYLFNSSIAKDIRYICAPTILATTALYIPIFILSIVRISKWIFALPIVIYLLIIPTHPAIRSVPVFNTAIAGLAVYYAQKVCEWLFVRSNEFQQWSFWDIHHELYFYLVYMQPVSLRKLNPTKKRIFYTGSIQYNKHLKSLIYLWWRILQHYLLFDLTIYLLIRVLNTDLYETYFSMRLVINLSGGWVVYSFLTMNHEMTRHALCLIFNRPLELIPELFRQPYRAISPSDFWARWHQIFKNTWLELIFKPTSRFLRYYFPHSPKFVIYSIASMSVFVFSGIVHEYIDYITFHKCSGNPLKFFILQGFAILIEHTFQQLFPRRSIPTVISFLCTFIFNGITAGYFLKPWFIYLKTCPRLKYSLITLIASRVESVNIQFNENCLSCLSHL